MPEVIGLDNIHPYVSAYSVAARIFGLPTPTSLFGKATKGLFGGGEKHSISFDKLGRPQGLSQGNLVRQYSDAGLIRYIGGQGLAFRDAGRAVNSIQYQLNNVGGVTIGTLQRLGMNDIANKLAAQMNAIQHESTSVADRQARNQAFLNNLSQVEESLQPILKDPKFKGIRDFREVSFLQTAIPEYKRAKTQFDYVFEGEKLGNVDAGDPSRYIPGEGERVEEVDGKKFIINRFGIARNLFERSDFAKNDYGLTLGLGIDTLESRLNEYQGRLNALQGGKTVDAGVNTNIDLKLPNISIGLPRKSGLAFSGAFNVGSQSPPPVQEAFKPQFQRQGLVFVQPRNYNRVPIGFPGTT